MRFLAFTLAILCFLEPRFLEPRCVTAAPQSPVNVPSLETTGNQMNGSEVNDGFDIPHTDWPWWRGPERNGTASKDQSPPITFGIGKTSGTDDANLENIVWKSPIDGRGHGSPTVVGDNVLLVTSDEKSGAQLLICFERASGKERWSTVIHESGAMWKNSKASAASCTPACDGTQIYVNFPNSDAMFTTAVDMKGRKLWQTRLSNYQVHQGYGASPALYQDMVIVSSDNKLGGVVAALERETGKVVWKRERPQMPNYSSPVILHVAGRDQLIMTGCDLVSSYDLSTGETIWETEGATTECVTSTLTNGNLVYTTGGYPKNHMSAVKADGSATKVWENKTRVYVPSLLIREGYLYGIQDAGIAMCWDAITGEEQWKTRLGGTFSSSPVLVGDRIFATNEGGEFFVFRATPTAYEELAVNKLGDQVFATPTIVGSQIFHRVAMLGDSGERQEYLICIGSSKIASPSK